VEQHPWDLTPEEAIALQSRLRERVQTTNGFAPDAIKSVAGIDVSLKGEGQAAVVVLSYPDLKPLDRAVATARLTFPYVPGLLSFRESPLVLAALERLRVEPDLLMVDGQGYAHPRRFGIACHLGLLTDKPAIGCAKSVLVGRYENLGENPGDQAPLIHRGETVGVALRTKPRTNPLIVSIGHRIDLPTAVGFVQACLRGYRLPEPTRAAHQFAGSADLSPVTPPDSAQGTLF
jgi:deoxyribonuclease V